MDWGFILSVGAVVVVTLYLVNHVPAAKKFVG